MGEWTILWDFLIPHGVYLGTLAPYLLNVSKSPLIIVTTEKNASKIFTYGVVILPLLRTPECVVGYGKKFGFYDHYMVTIGGFQMGWRERRHCL